MIPNILTTVRLILVPIFAYFILADNTLYATITFILSGITDIFDGFIARRFNMISNFGKVYDPFVDKLMQITVVVCLVLKGAIPFWLLVFVILKEVTMIIAGGVLYLKKIVVSSNWSGKAATVIFYASILIIILWKNIPHSAEIILFAIIAVSMLMAGMCYIFDIFKNYEKKRIC